MRRTPPTPPYIDPRWKHVRRAVLARDGHHCRVALPGCKTFANEVDHIIDWQDGGPAFDPANLRAACKSCNVSQRNRRVAARARAQRQQSRAW